MQLDDIDIPFRGDWSSIAISLSGGADSALLAYVLAEQAVRYKIKIHVINHIRMWKTRPWQQDDAKRVYAYLQKKFPTVEFEFHQNFIAPDLEYGNIGPSITDEYSKQVSGDNIQIRAFAEFVCEKNNVNAYYNAVTRNPREIDLGGMKERNIELDNTNAHLQLMTHMGRLVSHPFRFVDKSWILSQYKQLDIMDLFNITRSCEGEFDGCDYTNYYTGQKIPTCGECFWCKERAWAVECLG
jgi:7-cyano-7-deazaguanine synthase in queuosine biosynthesis